MSKTWILVANRSNARLFTTAGSRHELNLLQKIDHPEGQLKDGELKTDKAGRAFDSSGAGRHAMGKSQTPSEHEATLFAGELALILNKGRTENTCARLILVAEPGFLGLLKAALDDHTAKLVVDTVDKDFAQVADNDMPGALEKYSRL